MADKKISALTASTTPLAGTEVLPIVQGGATVKVAVSDLTAGRAISATQLTLSTGNLIVGTSGKGIDFSATAHAAGMTSELLADYEEGTWTPSVGGDATYTYRAATYTRIGRQIILQCDMIINAIGTGSTTLVSGIPFAATDSNFYTGAVGFWSGLNGVYAFVAPALQSGNIQFNTTAVASSNISGSSAIFKSGSRVIFSLAYIA